MVITMEAHVIDEKEKRDQRVATYVTDAVYDKLKLMALRKNTSISCIVCECLMQSIETMKGES